MGKVHKLVDTMTVQYLQQMRRYVYVTPKSYLSFISAYSDLYLTKYKAVDTEEFEIGKGLDKLASATLQIEQMSVSLKKEIEPKDYLKNQ